MDIETVVTWSLLVLIICLIAYMITRMPKAKIQTKNRATLVDTSVLMDGRIISIAKTGFIGDTLVIPRSVVGELQFLADNADADKRSRARMGLDVISELQAMPEVMVELLQDGSKATEGVDERLLKLAKSNGASLCTIDFNLNKVAVVEGIKVLNINELAQGLRLAHLPGEKIKVDLVQKGQDSHQGVGYLSDGTMVVVENSSTQIGSTVEVEVIRSLQTAAGKMMFAKQYKNGGNSKSSDAPKTKVSLEASSRKSPKERNSGRKPEGSSRQNTKNRSSKAREAAFIDLIDQQ